MTLVECFIVSANLVRMFTYRIYAPFTALRIKLELLRLLSPFFSLPSSSFIVNGEFVPSKLAHRHVARTRYR
jgi:hypothetical protein